jgi:hypothetical protein
MKESMNIWGIEEYEGDGMSCPIMPANLPAYKKFFLFFFRFGICPLCVTMSLGYSLAQFGRQLLGAVRGRPPGQTTQKKAGVSASPGQGQWD